MTYDSPMGKKLVKARQIKNPFKRFLILGSASGLGLGYAPIAPGTFGSLLGIPLGIWLVLYPTWASLIFCAIFLFLAVKVSDRAGLHWGNRDSGRIVIDEVLGQAIAIIGAKPFFIQYVPTLPTEGGFARHFENVSVGNFLDLFNALTEHKESLLYIGIAFGLFRLFDITKPKPAKNFDDMPSGWGVMMDDVIAGLYAALVLRILAKIVL